MATRYDQKTKDEVVSFIKDYNEHNGRGGQSAAAKKWNLNPITVKAWLEKAGVPTPGKTAKKKKNGVVARRNGKVAKNGSNKSDALRRMVEIQDKIEALQGEYDGLKARL